MNGMKGMIISMAEFQEPWKRNVLCKAILKVKDVSEFYKIKKANEDTQKKSTIKNLYQKTKTYFKTENFIDKYTILCQLKILI